MQFYGKKMFSEIERFLLNQWLYLNKTRREGLESLQSKVKVNQESGRSKNNLNYFYLIKPIN